MTSICLTVSNVRRIGEHGWSRDLELVAPSDESTTVFGLRTNRHGSALVLGDNTLRNSEEFAVPRDLTTPTAKPGIGGYGTLVGDYPQLADETLNLVLGELHAVGRHDLANRIARHAWDILGGRGPHLAAHIARTLAPRGLFTEAAGCLDEAAKHIPSSTTPAYRQLKHLSDYYRSKLTRVTGIDSDGNPTISPVSRSRRAPLRSHPGRFTRPEPDTNP